MLFLLLIAKKLVAASGRKGLLATVRFRPKALVSDGHHPTEGE